MAMRLPRGKQREITTSVRSAAKIIHRWHRFWDTNNIIVIRTRSDRSIANTATNFTCRLERLKCTFGHIHCLVSVKSAGRHSAGRGYFKDIYEHIQVKSPINARIASALSQTDRIFVRIYRHTQTWKSTAVVFAPNLFQECHYCLNMKTTAALAITLNTKTWLTVFQNFRFASKAHQIAPW